MAQRRERSSALYVLLPVLCLRPRQSTHSNRSLVLQITANLPGAAVGAFAGSRLGAIRDAKGKAVYTVFKDLPQTDKARILAELAKQVFGMSGLSGLAGAATGSR